MSFFVFFEGNLEQFTSLFNGIFKLNNLKNFYLKDLKNLATYLFQRKLIDELKNANSLNVLYIDFNQCYINQHLIETISCLNNLKCVYIANNLEFNRSQIDFRSLIEVNHQI